MTFHIPSNLMQILRTLRTMNTRRRRTRCLCLLLGGAPITQLARASSSLPRDSSRDVRSIQRLSKAREASLSKKTVSNSGAPLGSFQSTGIDQGTHDGPRTSDNIKASPTAAAATTEQRTSLSIKPNSIIALLQNILLTSSKPLLRTISITAQLAIAAYLTKISWNVFKEAWEEINQEYSQYKKTDDGREEQDLPFCGDSLSDLDKDGSEASKKGETYQTTAMRDLATRLKSSGIPYASELDESDNETSAQPRTVESLIKSLTRSEGNVLSQTLLTPNDVHSNQESHPESTAKAWNVIGGLTQVKESLLDLAFPLLPSSSSSNYYGGLLSNPPGVILYGPPGCGKSMLVRALANTIGARFLVLTPSCLLRKYVGETNLNVRALFSVAAKIAPCVIFVDELDGLFRERGNEDHDVSRDLKTEFLQLWDGIRHDHLQNGDGGGSVLVIGATNRPFDVDPAFLRRMPRRLFVGLPDYESRLAILRNMLTDVPLEASFDYDAVARGTNRYSPSDMREVLQAAALFPLREARSAALSERPDDSTWMPLSIPPLRELRTNDVLRALQVAKPTHFSKKYERDLMDYVHRSGGGGDVMQGDENRDPSVMDNIAFSSEIYNNEEQDDSDEYSYDQSESDDDL